jgi:hypothetical protein
MDDGLCPLFPGLKKSYKIFIGPKPFVFMATQAHWYRGMCVVVSFSLLPLTDYVCDSL